MLAFQGLVRQLASYSRLSQRETKGKVMTTEIGFMGAGNMGGPMVKNLLAADYRVVVYDSNQAAIDACVSEGAIVADSPKALADTVATVLVCLPTPDIVREVGLGADGLIHGKKIKTYV